MITAEEIINDMNLALKEFGTYSFMDKGPDEVMNLDPIVDELLDWHSIEEIAEILKTVSKYNEYGERLSETLVSWMDNLNDEDFDKLLELSGVDY